MRCPRCGNSVSDSEPFCPYCGQQMTDEVIAKSNKPLLIAMIAIVLALLVVTFLAFTGKLGPHDPEPEPAAAASVTPEQEPSETVPAALPTAEPAPEPTAEPTPTPAPTPAPTPTPEPTPEATVAPASGGTYILPDSNSRMLTEADLANLSDRELMLARNEIFARHGFIFSTQWLQGYFLTQGWYRGTTPASQFDSSVFNSYERANIDLILRVEAERAG